MDYSLIDKLTDAYITAGDFPAAVAEVFDEDGVLYRKAYGGADTETWFDMASVSKTITLSLIVSLAEEGLLSFSAPVLSLLPERLPGQTTRERLRGVTLQDLASHTSRLLPWFPFYADGRDFWTVLERALSETPPLDAPAYSDLNYMLLAQIFTICSGLSLRDGLDRYIKVPMHISGIDYGPVDPLSACPSCFGNQIEKAMCAERGITFDGWRPDGEAVRGTCNDGNAFHYFGGAGGHAGIFATADAMSRFGQYQLRAWNPLFVDALKAAAEVRGVSDVFPEGCGHDGFTGPSLWLSRKHHVGAVLLTNRLCRTDGKPLLTHAYRQAVHEELLNACLPRYKQGLPCKIRFEKEKRSSK